jgi:outer membrane protein OmpA-like peptidoglycan-associated protein
MIERSDYSSLKPVSVGDENPVELVQARYAVSIAGTAGAEQFAPGDYAEARAKLMAAETAQAGERRSERKLAPQLGREAVVAGEDARRAAMIGSAAAAREAERLAAASDATDAANSAAAISREAARVQTEADRERAAAAAASAADSAAVSAANAARADLLGRLNAALPTRDSPRGLVSEIGGVQFATGKSEISAAAKEGVSKFSGIVASYPELRFSVEGHTDSVGSVAANDALSLRRANAVREFLVSQGLRASSIDVAGFGASMPSGDNSTVDGRARNRRVDIVISGGPLQTNAR